MRRRYYWNPETKQLEEVRYEREPEVRTQISTDRHYENLCAQDGTDIGSRRKHQEYMKRNDLALSADFKETWAKAAKEREKFFKGDFDKAARREVIARALHQRKPR